MVQIAREILGSDEILYGGDSSFTINGVQHGFHKDNADRDDPAAPDWRERYTLLRFGLYLQDHRHHSGGLNLRIGSHNTTSLTKGKNIYLRTGIGDIAVWNLRASHSGNATLLSFPWWVDPDPAEDGKYPRWWRPAKKSDGDRIALFAALGLDDAHHDRYVEYLKSRTYMIQLWKNSTYNEETLKRAECVGLSVRDVPREVEGDETVGRNVTWAALPILTGTRRSSDSPHHGTAGGRG